MSKMQTNLKSPFHSHSQSFHSQDYFSLLEPKPITWNTSTTPDPVIVTHHQPPPGPSRPTPFKSSTMPAATTSTTTRRGTTAGRKIEQHHPLEKGKACATCKSLSSPHPGEPTRTCEPAPPYRSPKVLTRLFLLTIFFNIGLVVPLLV